MILILYFYIAGTVGFVGSCLIVCVLRREQFSHITTCLYMIAIALFDAVDILIIMVDWIYRCIHNIQ